MPRPHTITCRSLSVALVLALGLASPGCGRAPRGAAGTTAGSDAGARAPGAADPVDAVAVLPGSGVGDAFVTFLSPAVDAPVIARSDGIVSEVRVREGQRVAAGQLLARLDSDEQRLEVDYMTALSQQAEAEKDRAEKGAQEQWISRSLLDAARAKARAAQADLDLAKLALSRRSLLAPVAGTVWQVRAVAHRPVKTADVLFRVTDLRRLQAELYLPAALQARIHVGDAARLVPQGGDGPSSPVAATVSAVSPIVDPATSRFRVVLATTSAPSGLAGQPVRVEFGAARAPLAAGSAVLPRDAYLERAGDGLFAVRVDHGRARRVPVELGALRADGYEVLGGLAAGDLVLADGARVPKDSAYVTARLRAAGR